MSRETAKSMACGIIDAMTLIPSSRYQFRRNGVYFISGPMSGIEDWNREAFARCAEKLKEISDYVYDPAAEAPIRREDEKPHTYYMMETISEISNYGTVGTGIRKKRRPSLDALMLISGWETSYGAVMEAMVAHECGIDLVEWED